MMQLTLDALESQEFWRLLNEDRQANRNRLVFIYGIQAGEDGPVKIGWTRDPKQRLKTLQVGNPWLLRGLACWSGLQEEETWWHNAWAHLRLEGEWFAPDPELVDALYWSGGEFCDWTDDPMEGWLPELMPAEEWRAMQVEAKS